MAMRYTTRPQKRSIPKRLFIVLALLIVIAGGATIAVRHIYFENLRPLSASSKSLQLITIQSGASAEAIAVQLEEAKVIKSAWAFKLYIGSKNVRDALQAGTYSLSASQSIEQIVSQLTHGKVATDLVTIIPGQRIDQISTTLRNYGYTKTDVEHALNPANYAGNPALVDKPAGASLEGYIYPESYQKDANTIPQKIIEESLNQMRRQLTPDLRSAFAAQGLSTYQAIILASIVEQEVSRPEDRTQVAQVFLKRLKSNISLGSDVTAFYGSLLAHPNEKPSLLFDSPYNTRLHAGLPPGPIGNVTVSSLKAVANPATTDWLFFVAGDDGVTHFTHTIEEHDAAAAQYCRKLCE